MMMETEIKIGNYNTLKMTRVAERPNPHAYGGKESFGIFLDGGKEGEILMPQKYVPEHVKAGSDVHCLSISTRMNGSSPPPRSRWRRSVTLPI